MQETRNRQIGIVVLVLGILAILLAVLADPLGIGGKEDTFGWKQVALLVVGVVAAGAGVAVLTGMLGIGRAGEEPGGGTREPPMPPPD